MCQYPSVPGIADKLYPPQERKLEKVKKYWKLLLTLQPVYEIYGHVQLLDKDLSIDHFVPWSYVAHDEFGNLYPTTKSINSSKSNHLNDDAVRRKIYQEGQDFTSFSNALEETVQPIL